MDQQSKITDFWSLQEEEQNLEYIMKYLPKGATKVSSADIYSGLILYNITIQIKKEIGG